MSSSKWKTYLQALAWSVLALLLVLPLWYSLRTPFALIDDYGDFNILRSFDHIPAVIQWFHDTWFVPENRFRITFDLYQGLTWAFLGPHSGLHHAMRWVLKAVVVWSTFKVLRLMAPAGRQAAGLSFWVFCVIYIFFPNNPEARLAPVEMLTVTFLALLLYELGRLLVRTRGELAVMSLGRYLWLLFVFTAMLWSKETNVVIGMITFLMLAWLNQKRWMRLLPLAVIILITVIRVWSECKTGGYGKAPLTWDLIHHNLAFHGKSLLLAKAAMVGALLLGMGSLIAQTWKTRGKIQPVVLFSWLVCLNTLVFSFAFLTTWQMVLRYFYPVVYLLALWIALSLLAVDALESRWRRAVNVLVILASVYFIGANYYNFVYQFADQYYTRVAEQDVLRHVDGLLRQGHDVALVPDEEYEYGVENYFNEYLPYYKHTDYRIKVWPLKRMDDNSYYLTREPTDLLSRDFGEGFTVENLVNALRSRGFVIPEGSGVDFINSNILRDKYLYKRYPEVNWTKEQQDTIARISSLGDNAIKRFNRSLIERDFPSRSSKDLIKSRILLPAGSQWYRKFDQSHVSRLLWWCDRASSLFYLGHPAFYWRDLGADWIGRHGEEIPIWYIYQSRDIAGSPS